MTRNPSGPYGWLGRLYINYSTTTKFVNSLSTLIIYYLLRRLNIFFINLEQKLHP